MNNSFHVLVPGLLEDCCDFPLPYLLAKVEVFVMPKIPLGADKEGSMLIVARDIGKHEKQHL